LPKRLVYYKASSFKDIPVVIIAALHSRFIYSRRRSGKGIGSLNKLRGVFANITGLYG
jgi:hypothetical protein